MDEGINRIFRRHYRSLWEDFRCAARCKDKTAAVAWSCAMSEVAEVFAEINGISAETAETMLREGGDEDE